jgi:hypothetical protein
MKFDRKIFFNAIRPTAEVSNAAGLLPMQVDGLNQLLDFIEADTRWDEMDETAALRILAYFLGTVAHECTILIHIGGRKLFVKSFQPVEEMGGTAYLNRMYDTRTDLGNTASRDGDGARNAGDGFVQNTGGSNARTTGRRFAGQQISFADIPSDKHDLLAAFTREGGSQRTPITIDGNTFIREHELLRVPRISYLDAIDGMLSGRYTGKKISDYINEDENDTFNARRVINGITTKNRPKVVEIQHFAAAFLRALDISLLHGEIAEIPAEIPATNDTTPAPEPTPEVVGAEQAASAEAVASTPEPQAFTAFVPHIDSAKSWFKKAIFYLLGSNIGAQFLNLPPEIKYTLLALTVLTFASFIYLLIRYGKDVFRYVTQMNAIRAAKDTLNFDLQPHQ